MIVREFFDVALDTRASTHAWNCRYDARSREQVKEHYIKATLAAVGKRKFVLSSYSGGALYAMEMLRQLRGYNFLKQELWLCG